MGGVRKWGWRFNGGQIAAAGYFDDAAVLRETMSKFTSGQCDQIKYKNGAIWLRNRHANSAGRVRWWMFEVTDDGTA